MKLLRDADDWQAYIKELCEGTEVTRNSPGCFPCLVADKRYDCGATRGWTLTFVYPEDAAQLRARDEPLAAGSANENASLREANTELQGEVARLRGLLTGEPRVIRNADSGVAVKHWAAKLLAASFANELEEQGAENFFALDFQPDGGKPITVTIQRCGGKTPLDVIGELRAKLAGLERPQGDRSDGTPRNAPEEACPNFPLAHPAAAADSDGGEPD